MLAAEEQIENIKTTKLDVSVFEQEKGTIQESFDETIAAESSRAQIKESELSGRIDEVEKGFALTIDSEDPECLVLEQL